MRKIFLTALLLMPTVALAQAPSPVHTLQLTEAVLQEIVAAEAERPFKLAAPVIDALQHQIQVEMATAASEAAKAKPPPPASPGDKP